VRGRAKTGRLLATTNGRICSVGTLIESEPAGDFLQSPRRFECRSRTSSPSLGTLQSGRPCAYPMAGPPHRKPRGRGMWYGFHLTGVTSSGGPFLGGAIIKDALTAQEASDRVCGKRFKVMIPIWLPALEEHGRLNLARETTILFSRSALQRSIACSAMQRSWRAAASGDAQASTRQSEARFQDALDRTSVQGPRLEPRR
jgi:hypothetical protein